MAISRQIRAYGVVTALLCHVMAFFLYRTYTIEFPGRYKWQLQFDIVFGLSAALAVVQLFAKRTRSAVPLLLARFVMLLLLAAPLGGPFVAFEMILFLGFLVSLGIGLQAPWNLVSSIVSMAIFFLLQRPLVALGVDVDGAAPYDLIVFGLICLVVLFLSCLVSAIVTSEIRHRSLIAKLKRVVNKLSETNISMQSFAFQAGRESRVSERKTISREIHDSAGYVLTTILMMLKTGLLLIPNGTHELRQLLEKAVAQTEEGIVEIRSALHELRKKKIAEEKGMNAVHKLVKIFTETTGVKVKIGYGNVPNTLGADLDLFAFRFIQEGLLNALKHGNAEEITVTFWERDSVVEIRIWDNGMGCKAVEKGIGIAGMEERAAKLGGKIEIPPSKHGFMIQATVPRRV